MSQSAVALPAKPQRRYWNVFRAAVGKTLVEMKRYLFNTISGLITMYIVFLLLFYGAKAIGGPAFQTGGSLEGMVVGYTVWLLALVAYQDQAWTISMEAEIGTLEQLYLTPAGFSWVMGSFAVARLLMNLVIVGVIMLVMMASTGTWLTLDLLSIIPLFIITVMAPYGFGFMMAGLALVFKRIQNSFQILQFVFVAFLVAPIDRFPWMKALPLTMGNNLLQRVMVDGQRLWDIPVADLAVAAGVSLAYLIVGLVAFAYAVKVARDRGLMGHY